MLLVTGVSPLMLDAMSDVRWKIGATQVTLRNVVEGTITAGVVLVLALWVSAASERQLPRGPGRDLPMPNVGACILRALLLFLGLLSPTAGPIVEVLGRLGIEVDFLGQPTMALVSTVVMMTWRFAGFYMIILLAGLQALPRELYEAASIDGAGRWRAL